MVHWQPAHFSIPGYRVMHLPLLWHIVGHQKHFPASIDIHGSEHWLLRFCRYKRRYSNTAGNIVPVAHYIFFGRTHGKGTTLNKDKTRTGSLFLFLGNLVTTHVLVIIVPSGNSLKIRIFLPNNHRFYTRSLLRHRKPG